MGWVQKNCLKILEALLPILAYSLVPIASSLRLGSETPSAMCEHRRRGFFLITYGRSPPALQKASFSSA